MNLREKGVRLWSVFNWLEIGSRNPMNANIGIYFPNVAWYFFFLVVKGPAADATDALQP
jgi:hypothetical protein